MFRSLNIDNTLYRFFLLLALTSCRGDGVKDIRNHYFPLRELKEGLVYEYQPVGNDSLTPAYWYYRSFFTEDGIFLTKTYYEYELVPLQLSREEVVSNGMLLASLNLYETDSTRRQQKVPAEVLSGSAFPFQVRDSTGVFLYKVRWQPLSDPEATITLIKNRRYVKDTTVVYEGKTWFSISRNWWNTIRRASSNTNTAAGKCMPKASACSTTPRRWPTIWNGPTAWRKDTP